MRRIVCNKCAQDWKLQHTCNFSSFESCTPTVIYEPPDNDFHNSEDVECIKTLRAQLAEARGLLEETIDAYGDWYINFPYQARAYLEKTK